MTYSQKMLDGFVMALDPLFQDEDGPDEPIEENDQSGAEEEIAPDGESVYHPNR